MNYWLAVLRRTFTALLMSLEATILTFNTLTHQTPHEIEAKVAPMRAFKILRLKKIKLCQNIYSHLIILK
jgi:hypothetical protein